MGSSSSSSSGEKVFERRLPIVCDGGLVVVQLLKARIGFMGIRQTCSSSFVHRSGGERVLSCIMTSGPRNTEDDDAEDVFCCCCLFFGLRKKRPALECGTSAFANTVRQAFPVTPNNWK